MSKVELQHKYALLISSKLGELFTEEDGVGPSIELSEITGEGVEDNTTAFMHALLNLAPLAILRNIGYEGDILETNHLANRFIMQFSQQDDEDVRIKEM